ncbi:MAG: hypothetical protein HGB14_13500, partial [Anaerolineaceae bacterium]|nr:hypothetical protein [Anaerolineaceae bacterium]
ALLPHALSPQLSAIWWQAARFNQPLQFESGLPGEIDLKIFWVDSPNIVIDTIKVAEDGDGLVIRMYEASGSHTNAILRWTFDFSTVERCDLLERKQEFCLFTSQKMPIALNPFELVSFHFKSVQDG